MIKTLKPFLKTLRTATISPQISKGFCVYTAYLNPEKHIYMNHNPTNVYEDILQIGEYVLPSKSMNKDINRVYVPQITSIVFEELKKIYPNVKLDAKDYENIRYHSWKKYGVVDFDSVKNELLESLAQRIFVKENKFRYPIEQKARLEKTNYIYNRIKLNDYVIYYFVESYNILLRLDIDRSNLWRSPKIQGESSFLEKFNKENLKEVTGLDELRRDIPQNKTLINRLMEKLHRA